VDPKNDGDTNAAAEVEKKGGTFFETPAATENPKHCDANAHGPHNPICCSFRHLIMMSL